MVGDSSKPSLPSDTVVPKLDSTEQYSVWSLRMKAMLQGAVLQKFIDEQLSPTAGQAQQDKGARALSWIILKCSDTFIQLVSNDDIDMAYEAWDSLKTHCASKAGPPMMRVLFDLSTVKMGGISSFYTRLVMLKERAELVGESVSNVALLVYMTNKLPPEGCSVQEQIFDNQEPPPTPLNAYLALSRREDELNLVERKRKESKNTDLSTVHSRSRSSCRAARGRQDTEAMVTTQRDRAATAVPGTANGVAASAISSARAQCRKMSLTRKWHVTAAAAAAAVSWQVSTRRPERDSRSSWVGS